MKHISEILPSILDNLHKRQADNITGGNYENTSQRTEETGFNTEKN